jgi:hypothetical protein
MDLSNDFWNAYKGLVLVGDDGTIAFTRMGRKRYAPLFAKYGFALDNVRTVDLFFHVMSRANAEELEANSLEFERVLNDPRTSAVERELIRLALATGSAV